MNHLLLVDNVGNLEEELTATITGTTGPLTAALNDLDGQPAQTVPLFRLPGLSSGAILVDAELTDFGTGTITVLVSSLLDDSVTAEAIATITSDVPAVFDFGDAPASYGTLLADDGARHEQEGPKLGEQWDAEANAAAPLDGAGDDSSNTGSEDDEDGVRISNNFTLTVGQTATATVHISGVSERTARLFAWVDFNGNGSFEAGERVSDGATLLPSGDHEISFAVPDTGFTGTTYARFRATTELNIGPTGVAADGEVEDYSVNIEPRPEGSSSLAGVS